MLTLITLALIFISLACSTFAFGLHAKMLEKGWLRTTSKCLQALSAFTLVVCVVLVGAIVIQGN